jgi:DUF1365 family protein
MNGQQQTVSNDSKPSLNDDGDGWHLVGTFKTTTADIKHYYVVPSKINIDNYVCVFHVNRFICSPFYFSFYLGS